MLRLCKSCGQQFGAYKGSLYCSQVCRSAPAPAVYRYISPDGRSYVGSVGDCRNRNDKGIQRRNSRLLAAFKQHPPESFVYEVLEILPPGCSERVRLRAEQKHMERLRSWSPEFGFNIFPASEDWASAPAQHARSEFCREVMRAAKARPSRIIKISI